MEFEDGQHEVASFIRKPTCRVKISVAVSSNALLTVTGLLDTGAGLNLSNRGFQLQAWEDTIKSIRTLHLRISNSKFVNVEGIVPLFIQIGDLLVRTWFGTVASLSVDVLIRTSFIYQCIRWIFPTERKLVPWQSKPGGFFDKEGDYFDKRR